MANEILSNAFDGQSTQTPEINNFLGAQWRLPFFAADMQWKYHRGYMDASGNGFTYARNWLGTKIGVTNPVITHEIPDYVQSVVRGLIHLYRSPKASLLKRGWNAAANARDDGRAEGFLWTSMRKGATRERGFANWFRLGMYEPKRATLTIKKHGLGGLHISDARSIRFYTDVPYDLVLFVGQDPKPGAKATPPQVIAHGLVKPDGGFDLAPRPGLTYLTPAKVRWFKTGLYVPDPEAHSIMDHDTKSFYMRITGRARGEGNYDPNQDIYWNLPGWERALEALKIPGWAVKKLALKAVPGTITKGVGLLTGTTIPMDKPMGPGQNWRHEKAMQDDGAGDTEAGPATYARAVWYGQAHDFNRKSIVPPNFCFVKFNCLLSVKVVVMAPNTQI
jgi:hypothetical protein